MAGATRLDIEARTGVPVVSPENYRTLTAQERQRMVTERQPALFGDDGTGE